MAKKAVSAELTGGGGYAYEDACVAYYLTSLLSREHAAGHEGFVSKIAVQQGTQSEPLDDLIVHFSVEGEERKMSLQVKTKVTISGAKTNSDFRKIIQNSIKTLRARNFTIGSDKFGFVTESASLNKHRDLLRIIEWANSSTNACEFTSRFKKGGQASSSAIELRKTIGKIADPKDDYEEWLFYQHFVAIKLDGLQPDGIHYSDLVGKLNNLIVPDTSTGTALMYALWGEARLGAKCAKVWDRASILKTFKSKFKFQQLQMYADDLNLLNNIYHHSISEINQTIGDYHLDRSALLAKALEKSKNAKFTNISGLPGCGKSVVLRKLAEEAAKSGPVLFLKSDNLEDVKSWQSYANAIGIKNPLEDLLIEIGILGTPTLFIDGIDRIPPDQTKIICHILNTITQNEQLADWKVIASSRDQGLEAYRTWVPDSFFAGQGITDVPVSSLDDDETEILAKRFPELRSILFGESQVKEIARRPFFASVLIRQVSKNSDSKYAPKTESELINIWWSQGGYDSGGKDAYLRQRALIDLGLKGAAALGKKIPAKNLDSLTHNWLTDFADDGILDQSEAGIHWSFCHDIFFEWVFFKALVDEGENWSNIILDAGEAPLLDRVVSLFSQHIIETDSDWGSYYSSLKSAGLRKQWQRAWLLGPASSPRFVGLVKQFQDFLRLNDYTLLPKFLIWFQAERTIPNPMILDQEHAGISGNMVIKVADLMSWPSDTSAWARVFWWLNRNINEFGAVCPSEIVEFFFVWQNMFGGFENPVSEKIVEIAHNWRSELMKPTFDPPRDDHPDYFSRISREERSSFSKRVVELILGASLVYPKQSRDLIEAVTNEPRIDRNQFEIISSFSPKLSQVMPELLVKLTKAYVLKELPKDKFERKRKERLERQKIIEKIRAKPESERTDKDKNALSSVYYSMGYDDQRLSDDFGFEKHGTFHPTAPLHEPFKSLFENASEIAIDLVKDLSNHAILAWRQTQKLHNDVSRTPLPITIEFPWGIQEFWGGEGKVFSWYFGELAPNPLAAAYLEFTRWAHKELENGKPVDELIEEIVKGQDSTASLGLACSITVQSWHISHVTLALLSCQNLWWADERRQLQQRPSDITLMGINLQSGMSKLQIAAMNELEGKHYRKYSLKDLAAYFVFSDDADISSKTITILSSFPSNLPFNFEEDVKNLNHTEMLKKQAEIWAAWGDKKNYKKVKNPKDQKSVLLEYTPPIEPSESDLKIQENARKTLSDYNIVVWATKCFEKDELLKDYNFDEVIKYVRDRYIQGIFDEVLPAGRNATQSSIVATAALATKYSDDKVTLEWASRIIDEAKDIQDPKPVDRYSKPIWHPLYYVMLAMKEVLKGGNAQKEVFENLLSYCIHDNIEVAHAAFVCLYQFYAKYPNEVWVTVCLASEVVLENYDFNSTDRDKTYQLNLKRRQKALKKAIKSLSKGSSPTPTIVPEAWVFRARKRRFEWDSEEPTWQHPEINFNYSIAEKILEQLPVEQLCKSDAHGPAFITYIQQLSRWTATRLFPEWREDKRKNNSYKLNGWPECLSLLISRQVGIVAAGSILDKLIAPLISSGGDDGHSFINSISNSVACRHVYDAKTVHPDALIILDHCLDKLLESPEFKIDRYRGGELHGFDLPRIIKTYFFVSVDNCPGAARFANGEWQDYSIVAPLVDKLMLAAGWSPYVMNSYLKLCFAAEENIPIASFSKHISDAMDAKKIIVPKWAEYQLLSEIAILIQKRSEWAYPLDSDDANALLVILDDLIDLGNRRASALIHSESFRNLQKSS